MKKVIGIVLIVVISISSVCFGVFSWKKCDELQSTLSEYEVNTGAGEEGEKKIASLLDKIDELNNQIKILSANTEDEVIAAAEKFLRANFEQTEQQPLSKSVMLTKELCSEEVFYTLYPEMKNADPNGVWNDNTDFQSIITSVNSYYNKTSDDKATVFMDCTYKLTTQQTITTTGQYLFCISLTYIENNWICTEIHQKEYVRSVS